MKLGTLVSSCFMAANGFYDPKLGTTISVAIRMVSFDFIFDKLSEKVTFLDFRQWEQGF